tara:strand:- start:2650 stop:3045 length:396 start_codon:yes stop_codon:yes gene_type:complete
VSTLKVGTIQDTSGNNSSTPNEVANGRAKAWVNFNGSGTVAIIDSYNVASITDNGTGDYTINFTNAMTDADYCVSGGVSTNSGGQGYRWLAVGSDNNSDFSKTTSGVRVQSAAQSDATTDAPLVYAIIHGS